MKIDVVATLQKARDIITPDGKWCVGLRWKSMNRGTEYAHCALGAIEAVTGESRINLARGCDPEVVALAAAIPAEEKAVSSQLRGYNLDSESHVATYNNRSTHKTVLEWFDRAIELQKTHPMEKA
jgi:hypothetical protein